MTRSDSALEARARSAYEAGRLRSSVPWCLLALPLGLAAFAARPMPVAQIALTAALSGLVLALRWRGEGWGRGVLPGLAGGAFALVLPVFVRTCGHVCALPSCWPLCLAPCLAGGLVAGLLVGRSAIRSGRSLPSLVSGIAVAGVAGTMGCILVGFAGVAGMAGVLAATASIIAIRPQSASHT